MTNISPPIIFIADDDPEDLALLTEAMRNYSSTITIETFRKGDQLLEALHYNADYRYPDLIVLDYNMPPVTGPEILRIIKSNPHLQQIPKIVWSSSNNAQHIQESLSCGATAYFTKPFSVEAYLALAEKICAYLKLSDYPTQSRSTNPK